MDDTPQKISESSFSFPANRQRPKVQATEESVEPLNKVPAPIQRAPEPPPPQTQSQRDPLYFFLPLPSNFVFYPFKELSAAHIRGKHQAKFSVAAKQSSTRLTVEAITSLLGDGVNAADLTIPDFYAVMYWLRLNCYGKATLPIVARCSDPEHVLAVAENKKTVKSLENMELISKTNLKETLLDTKKVLDFLDKEEVKEFTAETGLILTAPRMFDSIEIEERWLERPDYSEIEFLADYAGAIRSIERDLSLEERIDTVGNLEARHIAILSDWQELVTSYGVEESTSLKCKECGAGIEVDISISAHDFL